MNCSASTPTFTHIDITNNRCVREVAWRAGISSIFTYQLPQCDSHRISRQRSLVQKGLFGNYIHNCILTVLFHELGIWHQQLSLYIYIYIYICSVITGFVRFPLDELYTKKLVKRIFKTLDIKYFSRDRIILEVRLPVIHKLPRRQFE